MASRLVLVVVLYAVVVAPKRCLPLRCLPCGPYSRPEPSDSYCVPDYVPYEKYHHEHDSLFYGFHYLRLSVFGGTFFRMYERIPVPRRNWR